jgi:hypothetical protein
MPELNMPQSNAERQASYRRRHIDNLDADDRERLARLNLLVSIPAKAQLERLAACYRGRDAHY